MKLPFIYFTKKEWLLWIVSMALVLASNVFSPEFDLVIMLAALIGVTALVFAAKGNVWAQVLMIIFCVLYGMISFRFHYWGEMITYLGMSLPMAIWSAIVWFRNPSKQEGEVEISRMDSRKWILLFIYTAAVTAFFYYVLKYFDTPNLLFSTISITTSFSAAALMIYRSSYYAVFYALNDLVLIVLWIMATLESPVYFPVIINFVIFFINDVYGFLSWKKRENRSLGEGVSGS